MLKIEQSLDLVDLQSIGDDPLVSLIILSSFDTRSGKIGSEQARVRATLKIVTTAIIYGGSRRRGRTANGPDCAVAIRPLVLAMWNDRQSRGNYSLLVS